MINVLASEEGGTKAKENRLLMKKTRVNVCNRKMKFMNKKNIK